MYELTEIEKKEIKWMMLELRPVWGEIIIKNESAPLPKIIPQVLGMSMVDGLMIALDDERTQQMCAHEIWFGLPDSEIIHRYPGFHIICKILEEEEKDD